jgi:FkbM family methyltransferase
MRLKAFLYRRLAHLITCELELPNNGRVTLENKYEVASFQDVFCHPFYWQLFQLINEPPNLVVDCGAHCGHFTILADICFRSKFNVVNTEYVLIEPNPYLLAVIRKNITDANISMRSQIIPGLLGSTQGHDTLWVNPKNYLSASLQPSEGAKPHQVPYINLLETIGDRAIDVMKIDIEGGEYNFISENPQILQKVNLLLLELHQDSETKQNKLLKTLASAGLYANEKPLQSHNHQLIIFQRQRILSSTYS